MEEPKNALLEAIWAAVSVLGVKNAPKISDAIISEIWPATYSTSLTEPEATRALRTGLIVRVKDALRKAPDDTQRSLSEIDPAFATLVSELRSSAYTVPSLDQLVTVADLVETPEWLREAAQYMQDKGMECLGEARRLWALYEAVRAAEPVAKEAR
jgi:hypothetical protein